MFDPIDRRTALGLFTTGAMFLAGQRRAAAEPSQDLSPGYFDEALRHLRNLDPGRPGTFYFFLREPARPLESDDYYLVTLPIFVAYGQRNRPEEHLLRIEAASYLTALNASERSAPEYQCAPRPGGRRPSNSFENLRDEYVAKFQTLTVRPAYRALVDQQVRMVKRFRPRYEGVERASGVPWHVVACLHALEASFNFAGHLHNGDPLQSRTTHVPANRPDPWLPPSDWEASAADALSYVGFARQTDWSLARTLYRLERYNGFGYRPYGVSTPYLWSFSNHYDRGKFVRDRCFDPARRSQQCGAAAVIRALIDAGDLADPDGPEEHSARQLSLPSRVALL